MMRDASNIDCVGRLGEGAYTIPDAARILRLPQNKVRRWIVGYYRAEKTGQRTVSAPVIERGIWRSDRSRALNFYAMIEVFTFMALRELGTSLQRVRQARLELMERFQTPYPFACHKLLCDGRQIIVILESVDIPILMILGEGGQTALKAIVEPFCHKIDFSLQTKLAERYWPLGKDRTVVVDPHHGFGRPTISRTNITTAVIASLAAAGQNLISIADLYRIEPRSVEDAIEFECAKAA